MGQKGNTPVDDDNLVTVVAPIDECVYGSPQGNMFVIAQAINTAWNV